ncbi:hypothetical protein DPMN_133743 [Dreissena polymorpha]|uniref:Uncharacterized protein n=1 Tax=Dreissena polymorpha TaxID=45954 RepID=A0A9D4FYW3_DREPO|nr:hypothetical protein DPMN_133743 [Dreissena polymorpha]
MVFISPFYDAPMSNAYCLYCRDIQDHILRCYSELLLRFYYDHEHLSTMLPRCLYDNGTSTTLFLRLYTDSCWPRSCYACFEQVQNKRGESVELSDHEDSTAIILRL